MKRNSSRSRKGKIRFENPVRKWLNYFMNDPPGHCPKCSGTEISWYDPFFFAPLRTLRHQRRHQCRDCRYVWRPQSREHGQHNS